MKRKLDFENNPKSKRMKANEGDFKKIDAFGIGLGTHVDGWRPGQNKNDRPFIKISNDRMQMQMHATLNEKMIDVSIPMHAIQKIYEFRADIQKNPKEPLLFEETRMRRNLQGAQLKYGLCVYLIRFSRINEFKTTCRPIYDALNAFKYHDSWIATFVLDPFGHQQLQLALLGTGLNLDLWIHTHSNELKMKRLLIKNVKKSAKNMGNKLMHAWQLVEKEVIENACGVQKREIHSSKGTYFDSQAFRDACIQVLRARDHGKCDESIDDSSNSNSNASASSRKKKKKHETPVVSANEVNVHVPTLIASSIPPVEAVENEKEESKDKPIDLVSLSDDDETPVYSNLLLMPSSQLKKEAPKVKKEAVDLIKNDAETQKADTHAHAHMKMKLTKKNGATMDMEFDFDNSRASLAFARTLMNDFSNS